ncbi:MAG TPA: iron-sulfur cluster assembly scaffold protein [Steroidobacteraceae bacterium]|jgi:NifU-like protein involved in Fe-S cluster formation|nr:iron-sulfur cluster assembly scaffold protein [Steroidobacteraceae bacterium]
MKYNELTRRYFESASCAGVLAGSAIFRGAAGSRAQGTWVQFDVQVNSKTRRGTIEAVRFLAFACPHVIAVAAWLAEQAVGQELRGQLPESVQSLSERFGVPVEKLGRLLLVEDAWNAAIAKAGGGH